MSGQVINFPIIPRARIVTEADVYKKSKPSLLIEAMQTILDAMIEMKGSLWTEAVVRVACSQRGIDLKENNCPELE